MFISRALFEPSLIPSLCTNDAPIVIYSWAKAGKVVGKSSGARAGWSETTIKSFLRWESACVALYIAEAPLAMSRKFAASLWGHPGQALGERGSQGSLAQLDADAAGGPRRRCRARGGGHGGGALAGRSGRPSAGPGERGARPGARDA